MRDSILFDCKYIRQSESGKAHLVEIADPAFPGKNITKELWLPDSQIEFYDNQRQVSIPYWLAKERELAE